MNKIKAALVAATMIAGVAVSGIANAAVTITSVAGNTVPTGAGTLITFDAAIPAGFTVTSSAPFVIQSGSTATGAAPAGDTTNYLSVSTGGSYQLLGTTAFSALSLYWGSIDAFNQVDLLGVNGSIIGTVTGGMVPPANGDQSADATNRTVTLSGVGSIYGAKFSSTGNAFELDNVKFQAAVPEPASWAMMVLGFGLIGAAARSRRTAVTFA